VEYIGSGAHACAKRTTAVGLGNVSTSQHPMGPSAKSATARLLCRRAATLEAAERRPLGSGGGPASGVLPRPPPDGRFQLGPRATLLPHSSPYLIRDSWWEGGVGNKLSRTLSKSLSSNPHVRFWIDSIRAPSQNAPLRAVASTRKQDSLTFQSTLSSVGLLLWPLSALLPCPQEPP